MVGDDVTTPARRQGDRRVSLEGAAWQEWGPSKWIAVLSETLEEPNIHLCLGLGGVGRREPWWVFLEGT